MITTTGINRRLGSEIFGGLCRSLNEDDQVKRIRRQGPAGVDVDRVPRAAALGLGDVRSSRGKLDIPADDTGLGDGDYVLNVGSGSPRRRESRRILRRKR